MSNKNFPYGSHNHKEELLRNFWRNFFQGSELVIFDSCNDNIKNNQEL